MKAKRVIFKQGDRWCWELVVNGVVVATSPDTGYNNKSECRKMADLVVGGAFRDADKRIRDPDT